MGLVYIFGGFVEDIILAARESIIPRAIPKVGLSISKSLFKQQPWRLVEKNKVEKQEYIGTTREDGTQNRHLVSKEN